MTTTFIDSGVLIAAARGTEDLSERAIAILASEKRKFVCSKFVMLEVIPKAIYYRQTDEVEFYETFFDAVSFWAKDLEQLVSDSFQLASQYGLAAMDALHIAAAISLNAEKFVTTEKSTKPMYRVTEISITSIFDE